MHPIRPPLLLPPALPALLALLTGAARAQTVAELVMRLAGAAAYEEETVSDEPSRVFADYAQLAARASLDELQQLAGHDAPVVRCYAVRALAERGAVKLLPALLTAHAADTAKVEARSGCVRWTTTAGDVMFEAARSRLDGKALLELGRHYVRTNSPLYAREWALCNLRFPDDLLPTIRKLALDGDAPAVVALARYGVDRDVPILIDYLRGPFPFDGNYQYLAAEISRDARLLPALAELAPAARRRLQGDNADRLRFWLRAITAQGSDDAARLLRDVLAGAPAGDKREALRKTVAEAIAEHPAPAFASLQEELGVRDRR